MRDTLDYDNNAIHRSYSAIGYDYHHHHHPNPWEKPHYATFDYTPTPYSMATNLSTGDRSSFETTKANPSFDFTSSFNPSTFSRRHSKHRILFQNRMPISFLSFLAELILPATSTSMYSSSNPFSYYPPSEFFFAWNNNPSFMRTQSASFQHYPQAGNNLLSNVLFLLN